jgi:uncharacterized protein (UPF0261 family)
MTATVAIVGCLDTKGVEVRFLRQLLESSGVEAHVLDAGVLGEPPFPADTPRETLAKLAGSSLEELRRRGDRGLAMETMCRGAVLAVRRLFQEGKIQGIIAAGGSANTTIATAAMRVLPTGFPKVMVSTLASGDVSPYVDTKDLTMMYSVVDIAGINRISEAILSNAARAVAAMTLGREADLSRPPKSGRPLIAATMFGVTTPCVTEARKVLEAAGYEVLVFHATGTGGRAMEGLIRDGYFAGVLDITTTELADELVGGVLSAGPERLTAAGAAGIPQVVSVGALDMVNFGPRETVPEKFRARKFYQHNPTVTLMRTTPEENAEIGRRIAERVGAGRGPAKVILPLRGVSLYAKAGGPFHDPAADQAALAAIRRHLPPAVERIEIDTDLNDPTFARKAAETLLSMLEGAREVKTGRRGKGEDRHDPHP